MNAVQVPDPTWSAQQRQWLVALGHVLYLTGGEPVRALPHADEAEAGAESEVSARDATTGRADRPPGPARRDRAAPAFETDAPSAAQQREDRVRPASASRLPDKLHFALIRASGCNPNAPGAEALFAQWPSSAELRANPAAKRALWPALRALRRHGGKPQ